MIKDIRVSEIDLLEVKFFLKVLSKRVAEIEYAVVNEKESKLLQDEGRELISPSNIVDKWTEFEALRG